MLKKILIRIDASPSDDVVLSAVIRDLHRCYPGRFATAIQTQHTEIWDSNPHLSLFTENDHRIQALNFRCSLEGNRSRNRVHAIRRFTEYLNQHLDIHIKTGAVKGDIHFTEEEKSWVNQVQELTGEALPFWIVAAGGGKDRSIKWWDHQRYQAVVDYFQGRILFVQVGLFDEFHPPLRGVIDLRGKTSMRELIRLTYHAQGVLSPASLLMHLAAAIEPKDGNKKSLACVIVAGGRESIHWVSYANQVFIHKVGALSCCLKDGCRRFRSVPLRDDSLMDHPDHLCVNVADQLPRCMDIITAKQVIQQIEYCCRSQGLQYMSKAQAHCALKVVHFGRSVNWNRESLEIYAFQKASEQFVGQIPAYPAVFIGRGIVICGGGETHFPCAWVCIHMLRKLGCRLPIQLWHLGRDEVSEEMARWLAPLGVECVDASQAIEENRKKTSMPGWLLKSYAILHAPFKETLLLDADNVPMVNPEVLFDTPAFKKSGAVFWPDDYVGTLSGRIWQVCDIAAPDEPEFESGQILVDKSKCWRPLVLALWYNEHADFYYQYAYGDKEAFHVAFRKCGKSYMMPQFRPKLLRGALCQHDFQGRRLFQHRSRAKWRLSGENAHIPGFLHEAQCLAFLEILRRKWNKVKKPHSWNQQSSVLLRTNWKPRAGWYQQASAIIRDFKKLGYHVCIKDWTRTPYVQCACKHRATAIPSNDTELILDAPGRQPTPGKRTIYITRYESSRLPAECVKSLNKSERVIVPCQWNATCFSASGVTVPLHVVSPGINSKYFRFAPMNMKSPCIFGATWSDQTNDIIALFQKAFPSENDVRLSVQFPANTVLPTPPDSRVQPIRALQTERLQALWLARLTCFVCLSPAESWGTMLRQAMAIGRPVIAAKFGGHADYLNEHTGYCVHFAVQSTAVHGLHAKLDPEHVIELMQRVYQNRHEARKYGCTASKSAARYTWQTSNAKLLEILISVGAF